VCSKFIQEVQIHRNGPYIEAASIIFVLYVVPKNHYTQVGSLLRANHLIGKVPTYY